MSHIAPKIVMIPNLASIGAILFFGISVLILVMLLPVIFKLRKLKGEENHERVYDISKLQSYMRMTLLVNIENEFKVETKVIQPLNRIIDFLPNLEA